MCFWLPPTLLFHLQPSHSIFHPFSHHGSFFCSTYVKIPFQLSHFLWIFPFLGRILIWINSKPPLSKVMWQDLPLPCYLNPLPDYSISGSWSTSVKKHLIATSGCMSVGENLLVEEAGFVVTRFSGCGWDYLILSLTQVEDETDNWLIILGCCVCMHLIFWCCPTHHFFLCLLLCCLGFVFRTCKSHFSFVLVSSFFFCCVLISTDLIWFLQSEYSVPKVDAEAFCKAEPEQC